MHTLVWFLDTNKQTKEKWQKQVYVKTTEKKTEST